MPYISQNKRMLIGYSESPKTAGELNYVITTMLRLYLQDKGESYQTYNDMMGVLAGALQELYRRKITPYEDKKIKENGDVY